MEGRSNLFEIVRKNGKYLRFALITASADQILNNSALNSNRSWVEVKDKSKVYWSSLKTGSGGCWTSFKTKSSACWTAVKTQTGKGWKVVKEKSVMGWQKVVDWSKKSYQYCKEQCEKCRPKAH